MNDLGIKQYQTHFQSALKAGKTLTRHPSDPTIAITDDKDQFQQAAQSSQYRGVILQREASAKQKIRTALEDVRSQSGSGRLSLNPHFTFSAKHEQIRKQYLGSDETNPIVDQEISYMAQVFNAITGKGMLAPIIMESFEAQYPHKHSFSVLNCVWFDGGTLWQKGNETLQVSEGDWFFMKPETPHGTPKTTSQNRIPVIYTDH